MDYRKCSEDTDIKNKDKLRKQEEKQKKRKDS